VKADDHAARARKSLLGQIGAENSGKHKLFSMPRKPAQPDHRGRGGVGEGSRRGQGGVRGGSSRVKADDHAPRPRLFQERDLGTITVDIGNCKGHDQYQDQCITRS